jgi:hypothetical protein
MSVADNQANDDNPQTSNVADLGEIVITASRPAQTAADQSIVPRPNILDRFSSYTYQAAVYMLTPAQLTAFQRNGKKSVTGYNLLFQSGGAPANIGGPQGSAAGAGAPDAGRNPFFPNDFYIDTITLENIPMGKGTRSAHGSTQLKFTVIEPSNITLIDCMYKAVQDLQPKAGWCHKLCSSVLSHGDSISMDMIKTANCRQWRLLIKRWDSLILQQQLKSTFRLESKTSNGK